MPPTPRRWPFTARLEGASATWRYVDEVLVRPQQDANVQTAPAARPGKDVTEQVQVLGNPTQKRLALRRVDLCAQSLEPAGLRGKDLRRQRQQQQPAARRQRRTRRPLGPRPPRTGAFPENPEYEVADEQVDVFRILPDGLWIPGHDSKVDCAQ